MSAWWWLVIFSIIALWIFAWCRSVDYGSAASECVYEHDLQYIRCCESRDRYDIISVDGSHYGAYQFDLGTWYSVGGTGLPNEATPDEQDYRAAILYEQRGREPWKACLAW